MDLHVSSVSGAGVPPSVQLRERSEGRGGLGAQPLHGRAEHVVHVPQEEAEEVTNMGKGKISENVCQKKISLQVCN